MAAAALLAAPLAMLAQPAGKMHRVGVLVPANWEAAAFIQSMRELGYVEGTNLILDVRMAGQKFEQLPALARELVKTAPDVIVAVNTPGTSAVMAATKTVPVVMVAVGDPVGTGFVSNLARPGGNVTGLSNLCGELGAKRLALLKEAMPGARRIAIMFNPNDPVTALQIKDVERAAPTLGIQIRAFPAGTYEQLGPAFDSVLKWRPNAVLWLCGQNFGLEDRTVGLAAKHRLPVMPWSASAMKLGGLLSYQSNPAEMYSRAAVYVDKILRGTKPADLPVEQPTKLVLTLNLKAAKAMGIGVSQSMLIRADSLIQ